MSSNSIMMIEMLFLLFRLLIIALLSPRVFNLFLIKFMGALKIDLVLSMFLLAKTVFTSLFSNSTLLVGETNTIVLEEVILEEEKSYLKPIQSEADF